MDKILISKKQNKTIQLGEIFKMAHKQGSTKRKFRKVREEWGFADTSLLVIFIIFFVGSIYLTLKISPYFIFLNIFSLFFTMVGLFVLSESKVYWEEIEE